MKKHSSHDSLKKHTPDSSGLSQIWQHGSCAPSLRGARSQPPCSHRHLGQGLEGRGAASWAARAGPPHLGPPRSPALGAHGSFLSPGRALPQDRNLEGSPGKKGRSETCRLAAWARPGGGEGAAGPQAG